MLSFRAIQRRWHRGRCGNKKQEIKNNISESFISDKSNDAGIDEKAKQKKNKGKQKKRKI